MMDPVTVRRVGLAALAGICVVLPSCAESPTVDAADQAHLSLVVALASFPGPPPASTAAALEKVDRLEVQVRRRPAGDVLFSTGFALDGTGPGTDTEVTFPLAEAEVPAEIEVRLLAAGADLFRGATDIVLAPGRGDPVRVELAPVPASLDLVTLDLLPELQQTVQLQGTVLFATGDPIDGAEITWSTVDPDIVSVTPTGRLTTLARGEAEIVAEYAPLTESFVVRVGRAIAAVRVEPTEMVLAPGETQQFTAVAEDEDGEPVEDVDVAWSSSDPVVAVVDDNGLATASEPGTAEIRATAEGVVGSASLTVEDRPDLVLVSGVPELPDRIRLGDALVVGGWEVENRGTASGGFSVGFYLSTDPVIGTEDVRLGGESLENGLGPDGSFTGSTPLDIPDDLSCGPYYLGILVDEGDEVAESDEDNNQAAAPIEVIGCDAPEISGVRPDPSMATGGDFVFRGTGSTSSRSILFTVDDPDENLSSVEVVATNSDFQSFVLVLQSDGDLYRAFPSNTVSGSGLPDDTYDVTITATDALGLGTTVELAYYLDRAPPSFFNYAPPPEETSAFDSTYTLRVSSSVFDSGGFGQVTVALFEDGDGNCSTTGDQRALIEGSEVDDQFRNVTAEVIETNGFDESFVLFNPGTQRVIDYCTVVTARDAAVTNTGASDPNISIRRSPTNISWSFGFDGM